MGYLPNFCSEIYQKVKNAIVAPEKNIKTLYIKSVNPKKGNKAIKIPSIMFVHSFQRINPI